MSSSSTNIGKLICIEGLDFSGKTTVIHELSHCWPAALVVREPGGTAVGEKLRNCMMDERGLSPRTFLLGMMTSRSHLFDTVILPELKSGRHVFSDRSIPSSWAYNVNEDLSLRGIFFSCVNSLLYDGNTVITPTYIFLDVEPEVAQERMRKYARDDMNHFDSSGLTSFRKRQQGYRDFMASIPDGQGFTVDANREMVVVQDHVRGIVRGLLK